MFFKPEIASLSLVTLNFYDLHSKQFSNGNVQIGDILKQV